MYLPIISYPPPLRILFSAVANTRTLFTLYHANLLKGTEVGPFTF